MHNLVNKYLDEFQEEKKEKSEETQLNVLFNYCCKKSTKQLTKEQIKNLYKNILFYFPCFEPYEDKEKTLYFNAIKQFSEPFEAEYDSNKIGDNWFRVIKLFRNWSSHNLFKDKDNMNNEIFCFLFFIESLLFIKPSKNAGKDELDIYEKNILLFEELCREFLADMSNESFNSIDRKCKKLEINHWALCKKYKTLPGNMIDVYDKIGNKETVYYSYLIDAFMSVFIDKQISYEENLCKTTYKFLESKSSEFMEKELFCIAYKIYEELNSKE